MQQFVINITVSDFILSEHALMFELANFRAIQSSKNSIGVRLTRNLYLNFKFTLCKWYLDDIFMLTDNLDLAINSLERPDKIHGNITLTMETKDDNSILLSRALDGSNNWSVYRKSTWTGQYWNVYSFCQSGYNADCLKPYSIVLEEFVHLIAWINERIKEGRHWKTWRHIRFIIRTQK